MVYENYKEGKISKTNEGRLIIYISNKEEHKSKVLSYPKYLMEKHFDRYLDENETVHHKDGNFLNNDINNLEVIDRTVHATNDAIRNKDIEVVCPYCNKIFIIPGSKLHYRNRKDRNHYGYFCSRSCSTKYIAALKRGEVSGEQVEFAKREKYNNSGTK